MGLGEKYLALRCGRPVNTNQTSPRAPKALLSRQDFVGGLTVIAIAVLAFWLGRNLPGGPAGGMGPYTLIKLGLEPAPMLLGFVLGRLLEEKLRQALALSEGSFMTFVERPVAAGLLALALAVMVIAVLPAVRKSREQAFQE